MESELKERIATFADNWVANESYRSFDDFEDMDHLTDEINQEFELPFEFNGVTGEDAYIYVTHWSPELGHSVILDYDWLTSFANGHEFADEVERTYEEFKRVRGLLEQIKK